MKFLSKQYGIFLLSLQVTSFPFVLEISDILHHFFYKNLTLYTSLKLLLEIPVFNKCNSKASTQGECIKKNPTKQEHLGMKGTLQSAQMVYVGPQMFLGWALDRIPRILFLEWQCHEVIWVIICLEQYLWFLACAGNFNSGSHMLRINTWNH